MTLETLERTYRSPWLAQFGLYKYESAEHFEDTYHPSKKCRFGFLLLCGVLLVLFLVTYFIITDLSRVERVGVVGHKSNNYVKSEIESRHDDVNGFPADVVEMLNNTENDNNKSLSESLEEGNITEALNHRSSYAVQPQKLVFLPSRHLRPPKMDTPVRAKRRRDYPKRRNQTPKPFNHYIPEPHPAPFKQIPTRRLYDPTAFKPYIPGMQDGFRPVMGSYRRPKGTVPTYYQTMTSNHHASYIPDTDTSFYGYQPTTTTTTVSYVPDPFHKFKPALPADVNLLVLDQPSRETHLKMYNEQYLKNAQKLYQQVVKASRQKMSDLSRGSTQKHRPFQLMLDVYPMADTDDPTKRPTAKYSRFSPYAAKYNALNSINHDKSYDSSYFNRMRFAQIQPKNPHMPFYEHPYFWKINQEGKYVNDQLEAGSETQTTTVTGGNESPSQLVVHLNLFPKKKKRKGGKRIRRPVDYDIDLSEEDSVEYFRRSSVESDEIFEDDALVMTEKKYTGRPLRSTNTKESDKRKPSPITNETNNMKNFDKEDSSSIAINFNFPSGATKAGQKNCTQIQQKFIPMMDGDDNDIPLQLPHSSIKVQKAHDFPYKFASMPPAHIKSYMTLPMRHNHGNNRFQNRMIKLESFDEVTTENST